MKHCIFIIIIFNSLNVFAGNYPAKKTIQKPIFDGSSVDNCWNTAIWAPIDQLWVGTAASSNNYSGRFKVAWDDSLVYILVEVTDDIFHDTHFAFQGVSSTAEQWCFSPCTNNVEFTTKLYLI